MSPPIATATRPAGTLIGGKYRLGKLLGEGGMGAVYEAISSDGQRYALKILHEEMAASPDVVARFLAEGDMCRRLDHPGILRVFDMGNDGGVPYLLMELLQGRALVDYTEHGQRLPVNFAVTVCAGVLHALEYAHARNVIHRDMKPENVFLCAGTNGQYHAKLLDFGIARAIDAAGGANRRTATGVLLGTPGYMSPEQVKSARTVDHRCDLWAVGVMFYEMVTGSSPFPSDSDDPTNIFALISAVLTKEALPLSTYDAHLVPFDAFIHRALHRNIEQRYASAREMSDDLLRISRGEAPLPQSAAATPGRFTAENRAYPVNSQGELAAIPAMAQRPSGSDLVNRTAPTGGELANSALGGTVPMTSGAPMGFARAPAGGVSVERVSSHAQQPSVAGTVLAAPAPLVGVAGTVLAAPAGPSPFTTAPTGFAPPAGAAPVIPPNWTASGDAVGVSGGGLAIWIVIGAVLVAALAGALLWAAH